MGSSALFATSSIAFGQLSEDVANPLKSTKETTIEERDIVGKDEVISGSTKDEDLVRPTQKKQKKQALTKEDVEEELPLEEDVEDIKVLPVVEEEEEEDRDAAPTKNTSTKDEDLVRPTEKTQKKTSFDNRGCRRRITI